MTGKPTTTRNRKSPAKKRAARPKAADPHWLDERVRQVVRIIKALRQMSDEEISKQAGYSSRQVYLNRMSGRTPIATEDMARIASALRVEPHVLMMQTDEALRWTNEHETYTPPTYRKQKGMPARGEAARKRSR